MKLTKETLKKIIEEELKNFNEFLNEQEEQAEQTKGLVDINAGPEEVLSKVPQMLSDPKLKDVLRSGLTDGDPNDEKITIKKKIFTAKDLRPTQSQIGTDQSLNDQASDNDFGTGGTTNLDRAIKGGKLASRTGEFPLLVFKNYILDGHHRWSQFITTNPNAKVEVASIEAPGIQSEKAALALLHYMNFALYGKSPTKDFEGINVYSMNAKQIYQQALKNMAESTPRKLAAAGLISKPDAKEAAKYFANNLSKIPGPGNYPRLKMPQPGDAGSPDGYATSPKDAEAGVVNYLNPTTKDIK
jgi:hypothetical protein